VALDQYSQYPAPRYTVAHLSDTHLVIPGEEQFGKLDPEPGLVKALQKLADIEVPPQAIVVTGDLADRGRPAAYARLKELIEKSAAAFGVPVIWAMGNHDDRAAYSRELFGEESTAPQDRVHELDGLRIVSLDTSVPGYHHGEIEPSQLEWLAGVLATPAEHGTLLAMHHPPIPLPMDPPSRLIELDGQAALAEVLRGTDVRAILAGHMHYSTYATFAGIPVFVNSASCYTMELGGTGRAYGSMDANQAIAMVHVYDPGVGGMPEAPVTHTVLPLADGELLEAAPFDAFAEFQSFSKAELREMFSKHGEEMTANVPPSLRS